MTMMASGLSVTNAFWQAYAKTLAQVQKDLDQYLRGSTFNAVLFDIKLQKSDEEPDVEPAPPLESSMVLADLLALTNKKEEARQNTRAWPNSFRKAGRRRRASRLALREKDIERAGQHFARAAELGSTNPRLYYDYAMVLRTITNKDTSVVPILKKAVELDPDYQAHHYLAFSLLQAGDYRALSSTLRR